MVSFVVTRWQIAIVIYVIFVATLLWLRPALMFDANGEAKAWGPHITETTTPFAAAFVFPFAAILCYYISTLIDVWASA